MPKLGSEGKIHVSIVKRKRPDGSRYVQEVRSVYDPKTKNSKTLSSKTLGILPPGETDLNKLIPSDNRPFMAVKRQVTQMSDAKNVVQDTRKQHLVVFPLEIIMVVILLAGLAGFTSCRQVAEYWHLHRSVFRHWFPNLPDQDISHDTVRNAIKIVGRSNVNDFIEHFTTPLMEQFKLRVMALDGQAVRAASSTEHPAHSRYVLNLFDTDNELCVQQVLIEEKAKRDHSGDQHRQSDGPGRRSGHMRRNEYTEEICRAPHQRQALRLLLRSQDKPSGTFCSRVRLVQYPGRPAAC